MSHELLNTRRGGSVHFMKGRKGRGQPAPASKQAFAPRCSLSVSSDWLGNLTASAPAGAPPPSQGREKGDLADVIA
jgi:hypothetical protein